MNTANYLVRVAYCKNCGHEATFHFNYEDKCDYDWWNFNKCGCKKWEAKE